MPPSLHKNVSIEPKKENRRQKLKKNKYKEGTITKRPAKEDQNWKKEFSEAMKTNKEIFYSWCEILLGPPRTKSPIKFQDQKA